MQIKYSKKKEEMRHDPVMESILSAREYLTKHSNTVLSVITAAAVLFAAFYGYSALRKSGERHAAEAFGKAMIAYSGPDRTAAVEALSLVNEKHRSSPQGAYSAFLLGQIYLQQEDYKEAITWLELASRHPKGGITSGQALEALASCYEATEDYERSIEYLNKSLNSGKVDFKAPVLRWKAALACRHIGKIEETRNYCRQLLSDTLASPYHQKAKNLMAEMDVL